MTTVKRVGLVVPANNTVIEPEFYAAGVPGVTFHAARAIGSRSGTSSAEGLRAIVGEAGRAVESLAIAGVDLVVYACLSTSLFNEAWEDRFAAQVAEITDVPTLTAFEATADSIRSLGARRLALVDPYGPAIHERLAPAMRERGISSAASHSLNLPGLQQVCRTPPEVIVTAIAALLDGPARDADAVAIVATDLQTMSVLPRMNARFDRPVISTNQAILSAIVDRLRLGDAVPAQPSQAL